jgi:hypothetical protein
LLIADSPEAALNRFPVVSGQLTLDAEGVALRQFLGQTAQRGLPFAFVNRPKILLADDDFPVYSGNQC